MTDNSLVFGPIPSRRLGRSLGINNIPLKRCSYSCVYCQVGNYPGMTIERQSFYQPKELVRIVSEKMEWIKENNESVDYITFVPDGEPTLDCNLGEEIDLLHSFRTKIGVITNASLIWRDDVRQDLLKTDWISIKLDTIAPESWHKVNRPHGRLNLDYILEGIVRFSNDFEGELTTETMLVKGLNDTLDSIKELAEFLDKLKPGKAYLAVPTRPPAEEVCPAGEDTINAAYNIFSERLENVECLTGYEGNEFSGTGDIKNDLLGITAVHPMRRDAVRQFLEENSLSWTVIEELIQNGQLKEVHYQGHEFFIKAISSR